MLTLSTDHQPLDPKRIFRLNDEAGVRQFSAVDLGKILDWLDDEGRHEFRLHTGTRRLTLRLTRERG